MMGENANVITTGSSRIKDIPTVKEMHRGMSGAVPWKVT